MMIITEYYNFPSIKKLAFLCSRNIKASVVLKCYDWAIEQRNKGNCIMSGFQSSIEKDVFYFLLKGSQPIIMVLARSMKKRFSTEISKAINEGRLLVISPFEESHKRVSENLCELRNRYMIENSDKVVIGYANPKGNLIKLIKEYENQKEFIFLSES